MTAEQLKKANEIQKEIDKIEETFKMLDSTIKWEEGMSSPVKSFIRLINASLKFGEEPQAHVLLFRGTGAYGSDIPVDLDFVKYLRSYFQDRLDEKKKELGDI
jgi:hypothetical protein